MHVDFFQKKILRQTHFAKLMIGNEFLQNNHARSAKNVLRRSVGALRSI